MTYRVASSYDEYWLGEPQSNSYQDYTSTFDWIKKDTRSYEKRIQYHGAQILISEQDGKIWHESASTSVNKPLVRSYKEGLRVGCNFITNDAIELIYKLHKSFLSDQDSRTHQE